MSMLEIARKACAAGIRPIPIKPGTKSPVDGFMWGGATAVPTDEQVRLDFAGDTYIAAQAGSISGNLVCFDFDDIDAYTPWREILEAAGLGPLLDQLYVQQTPRGGVHVVFRVDDAPGGNEKLASMRADGALKVRIETRSEKGYFLIAPTPGYVKTQGSLARLPVLSKLDASEFRKAAKALDLAPKRVYTRANDTHSLKPGDDYIARTDWTSLLVADGWTLAPGRRGSEERWYRPGKTKGTHSATLNHVGTDKLHVFTSSTPIPPDSNLDRFGYFAFMHHGGDFAAAARDLVAKGYGKKPGGPASHTYKPDAPDYGCPVIAVTAEPNKFFRDAVWMDDVEEENVSFIWEPYFMRGQLHDVVGRGGSNKSSLLIAIGIHLGNGRTPLLEPAAASPTKMLYLTPEDTAGAYKKLINRIGGMAPKTITFWSGVPSLDEPTCEELAEFVKGEGIDIVVCDPVINMVAATPGVRNILDRAQVGPVLERLREHVCFDAGACVVMVRHDAMGASNRPLFERGNGSMVWHSSCRSQMIIVTEPGDGPKRYCHHTKGSINVQAGAPFAYGWDVGDRFTFWVPTDAELEASGYDRSGRLVRSGGATEHEPAEKRVAEFLGLHLTWDWQLAAPLRKKAVEAGLDPASGTFKRVQSKMADSERRDNVYYWRKKDPYADKEEKTPHWAGLD